MLKFDTQNPYIFGAVLLASIFFIFISIIGILALFGLLYMVTYDANSNAIPYIIIVIMMIILGMWNLVSSVQLIGDMNIKRLIGIILRSLIIITPFIFFWIAML